MGDLGNIVTPAGRFTLVKNLYQSLTPVSLFDGLISLDAEAENGIAGRAIVVHAGEDDLGMNYFGLGLLGLVRWAGAMGGCDGRVHWAGSLIYGSLGSAHC